MDSKYKLSMESFHKYLLRRLSSGAYIATHTLRGFSLVALAICLILLLWEGRYSIFNYEVGNFLWKVMDITTAVICVMSAVALTICILILMGGPIEALKIYRDFERIGFTNEAGEAPYLLATKRSLESPDVKILEFHTCGLPLEAWEECKTKIMAGLNITIAKIEQGIDNQKILVYALDGSKRLPTYLPFDTITSKIPPNELWLKA